MSSHFCGPAKRLLAVNGAAVTSNANGSVTAYGSDTYTWDVRNRLKSEVHGGVTYLFGYDADGLRTKKTVGSTVTEYLLEGGSVVKETTGGVAKHTLQSPSLDLLLSRDGKWFVPANLGSTAALTDGAGVIAQTYGYTAFGELTGSVADPNPFQFTGRENDGTGLMYYRARYYAPQWGRFISEDPIGFKGGINQYVYTDSDPVNRADPSGLSAFPLSPNASYGGGIAADPFDTDPNQTNMKIGIFIPPAYVFYEAGRYIGYQIGRAFQRGKSIVRNLLRRVRGQGPAEQLRGGEYSPGQPPTNGTGHPSPQDDAEDFYGTPPGNNGN